MTEAEFLKKSFKPFLRIEYKNNRMNDPEEYMLVGVDFDERLLLLASYPDEDGQSYEFPARCEFCELARPKPKLMKDESQ